MPTRASRGASHEGNGLIGVVDPSSVETDASRTRLSAGVVGGSGGFPNRAEV